MSSENSLKGEENMKASDYEFSEEEIRELGKYRDNQNDCRLKIRFIALLMLATGSDADYVASVIGKSAQTIGNWLKIYISEGIGSLNSFKYKPKKSFLGMYEIHDVIIWVTYENPPNIRAIVEYIKDRFGVSYCDETVRKILGKYGLKSVRPKKVPGKLPSPETQMEFVEKYENMKASLKPGSVILFADAMHLIHQAVPMFCWGNPSFPPVLPTNSGRKRLNVLGAYNPADHSLVHITGEENCNADRILQLFDIIIRSYPDAPEIRLIADNAKYFHAGKVSEWLGNNKKLNIRYLPSYAPNPNLIERLWGFVKEKITGNKYYEKYKTFRAKVFRLLNNLNQHKNKLITLMTEKFEIIYA